MYVMHSHKNCIRIHCRIVYWDAGIKIDHSSSSLYNFYSCFVLYLAFLSRDSQHSSVTSIHFYCWCLGSMAPDGTATTATTAFNCECIGNYFMDLTQSSNAFLLITVRHGKRWKPHLWNARKKTPVSWLMMIKSDVRWCVISFVCFHQFLPFSCWRAQDFNLCWSVLGNKRYRHHLPAKCKPLLQWALQNLYMILV